MCLWERRSQISRLPARVFQYQRGWLRGVLLVVLLHGAQATDVSVCPFSGFRNTNTRSLISGNNFQLYRSYGTGTGQEPTLGRHRVICRCEDATRPYLSRSSHGMVTSPSLSLGLQMSAPDCTVTLRGLMLHSNPSGRGDYCARVSASGQRIRGRKGVPDRSLVYSFDLRFAENRYNTYRECHGHGEGRTETPAMCLRSIDVAKRYGPTNILITQRVIV